ncbi:MAG: hypothetical protein IH786_06345 [Proteobacteria bacterium]|nr:hypothetical protein [Pseudomonadota bacterium]
MPRSLLLSAILVALLAAAPPEVWAQASGELPCAQASGGADCPEATRRGGWGLIFLGALFFSLWFMPPRANSEKGRGFMDSLPMMGTLQRRLDKELSGWRRFQWPLIGLSFMALGFAFLFGWL